MTGTAEVPSPTSGPRTNYFASVNPFLPLFPKGRQSHPPHPSHRFRARLSGDEVQENTLKCIMKTRFLPEKGVGVCLRNNYHYQPEHPALPRKILRHSGKGKTSVFAFTHNFLHTGLVGSQFSATWALILPSILRKK